MNGDSQNDHGEDGFVMTKALPGYDSRSESLDSFRASFTPSLFAVHQLLLSMILVDLEMLNDLKQFHGI